MQSFALQLWPFFEWLLRTTVQAAVLVCMILLIQLLLRDRLGARLRYCLWLLLLIRLVMPWAPESRLSVFNLFGVLPAGAPTIAMPASAAAPDAAPPANQGWCDIFVTMLPVIWLAGAVALAGYLLVTNLLFWRRIRRADELASEPIRDLLEDCKRQMRLRRPLTIAVTDAVNSPSLFGCIRPRLLLPAGMVQTLGSEQLRHIFLHELAHLRHMDILASNLVSLLQILHWFNPMLWVAFYRMRTDRELACDELVLSKAAPDESKKYGRTIISLAEKFGRAAYLPVSVQIMENKNQLKRRITMIARFRKLSLRWSLAALGIVVLVAGVALTNATNPSQTAEGNLVEDNTAMGYGGYAANEDGPKGFGGYAENPAATESNDNQAPMMYVTHRERGDDAPKGFGGYGGSEDAPKGFGAYGGNPGSAESDDKQTPLIYGAYAGSGGQEAPKGFGGGTAYFAAGHVEAEPNVSTEPRESE